MKNTTQRNAMEEIDILLEDTILINIMENTTRTTKNINLIAYLTITTSRN